MSLRRKKKNDAKARTVFYLSKADLEEQLKVSRGEQARLDLRKEAIRRDRVKLNKLLQNGQKRINDALVKQTLNVETTNLVCSLFYLFCSLVRFANFFPC